MVALLDWLQATDVSDPDAARKADSLSDGTVSDNDRRDNEIFTIERFREAYDVVRGASSRKLFKRTPLVAHWRDTGDLSQLSSECELFLKLENTQVTGK